MEHKRCTATHPDKPNFSGHARGRKLHLTKNNERTFCNMLIDEIAEGEPWIEHMLNNGKCKICFQGERKEQYKDTFNKLYAGRLITVTE